jgi:hypothetical protein
LNGRRDVAGEYDMNIFNSENVTKRALRALESHVNILINSGKDFEKADDKYYMYFEDGSEDYMKIAYDPVKKIISRTYNMQFTTVIKNVDFGKSFVMKMKYNGFPHISDVYFQVEKKQGSKEAESMFNDEKLKKELLKLVSSVDLAYCKIEYLAIANEIKITICPYAGSYLWVVFPPVFYSLRLSEKEMNALHDMGVLFRNHINMLLS